MRLFVPLLVVSFLFSPEIDAGPLGLVLPTDNDAIFSSDPSKFYMYTDRNFEGVKSQPWEGGTYGFSRNPRRTGIGLVYTRIHEGIDIAPVRRDADGEPLDDIYSISEGTVVYVNDSTTTSNYGRYIVVHHDWGYGPFFSLYAHLHSCDVKSGQRVAAGQKIARMGYTGAGINRTRAHVHVELCMLLSDQFQKWYDSHFTSKNHHGIFNGFNLTGMDIASLLKAHRADPTITIDQFNIQNSETYYKVLVPAKGQLEFLRRYPYLGRNLENAAGAGSWEFAFAATGVPLSITPSSAVVTHPAVSYVKPSGTDHSYQTVGRITGTGNNATLTPSGSRYIQLITDSF